MSPSEERGHTSAGRRTMGTRNVPFRGEGTHLCRKKDYGDEECPLLIRRMSHV
jgi:hypothetical protein